jgi:hypothetical protein
MLINRFRADQLAAQGYDNGFVLQANILLFGFLLFQ